jgi:hypothetical protein
MRSKHRISSASWAGIYESAPGPIRTGDLRIRSPTLYPAELQARGHILAQSRGPGWRKGFSPCPRKDVLLQVRCMAVTIAVAVIFGAALAYLAVQRRKAARRLAEEKAKSESLLKRIQADLEQAARIQRDLLPKADPRIEGYDVAGVNIPCYEIGGDYYDFIDIAAGRLGLVIADVSGKGISASLLMASLRAALLAEVRSGHSPDQLAARLSDFVHESSGPSSFVTFFFAELDLGTGELSYVNAGHNPPFVLDRGRLGARPRVFGTSVGHVRRIEIQSPDDRPPPGRISHPLYRRHPGRTEFWGRALFRKEAYRPGPGR